MLSEFLRSTMAASTSACTATETRVDYLKEAKLVPPWHSKSKVWCYFGFKEQGGNKEFVYCVLCKTKLKKYNQPFVSLQKSACVGVYSIGAIENQAVTAAIRTVWSHWMNSWGRKTEASLWSQPDYREPCVTQTLYCTHLASLYIFLKWYSLKDLRGCMWALMSRRWDNNRLIVYNWTGMRVIR